MDTELLLTGTKWQIIELLSKENLSPLEISKRLNTSIANISQLLRLLSAAGIVKKDRAGTGLPGKPRMLFSISDNFAIITIVSKGFAARRLLKVNDKQILQLKKI